MSPWNCANPELFLPYKLPGLNSALLYCSQCSGKKLVFWKIIRITLTLFLLIVALSHVYCSSLIWRHLPMTRRHVERHNAMLLWPALRGCAVAECCVCHAVSRHVSRHIHHVTRHAAFILILHTLGHRSHLPWRPFNLNVSDQRQFHLPPALFTCLMKN